MGSRAATARDSERHEHHIRRGRDRMLSASSLLRVCWCTANLSGVHTHTSLLDTLPRRRRNPVLSRSYNRINEDSVELNRSCFCFPLLPCGCETCDLVTKQHLDTCPFAPCCCGKVEAQFVPYTESCYILYCIPLSCCYDICAKPCCGEMVACAPCYCEDYSSRLCCIHCCSVPFRFGFRNSENFVNILNQQIRKVNGLPVKGGGGTPPTPEPIERD